MSDIRISSSNSKGVMVVSEDKGLRLNKRMIVGGWHEVIEYSADLIDTMERYREDHSPEEYQEMLGKLPFDSDELQTLRELIEPHRHRID